MPIMVKLKLRIFAQKQRKAYLYIMLLYFQHGKGIRDLAVLFSLSVKLLEHWDKINV
jgi:hypothetical protein